MRICIINEFFYPDGTGGTGTVLSSLVRQLRDSYPEVSIDVITTRSLYRGEGPPLSTRENWDGVQIRRIGVPRPRGAGMVSRLGTGLAFSLAVGARLALRQRYDCVLVTTAPPTLPLATQLSSWLRRSPSVYIIYDLFPDVPVALKALSAQGRIAKVCRKFQGRWLRSARKVVVLGRCMRDYLCTNYGVEAGSIAVIPIWSDQTELPKGTETSFRRDHGLSGPIVLYSGNFGQCQDFDTLLDAAQQMRDRRVPGTWVFVGEGAKKEHIARRIEEEKLTNVRMFPFVPHADFADLLASADISLVTLEPGAEGLGVPSKFYNILASGRATVAVVSRSSEVARVLEEEKCGVVVSHGDASHLAATISSLTADSPRRHRMGQAARNAFESHYTIKQAGQKFHSLLMQVAQPKARTEQDANYALEDLHPSNEPQPGRTSRVNDGSVARQVPSQREHHLDAGHDKHLGPHLGSAVRSAAKECTEAAS